MKKKYFVIIISICALLILTSCAMASSSSRSFDKQLELGYKFLEEGKYEEAIIAFEKAIEIDPKQPKAYIGLAETYIYKGGDNAEEKASEVLKLGYEETQSNEIINAFIALSEIIEEVLGKEASLRFLQFGYKITNDDNIKKSADKKVVNLSYKLTKDLYSLCDSNNDKQVFQAMASKEFNEALSYIEGEPLFYSPNSPISNKNGKGIGIYDGGYIYFGYYENNERNGIGKWFKVVDDNYNYVFEGYWENDKPNGYGIVNKTWLDPTDISEARIEGFIKNGLWNGEVDFINTHTSETIKYSSYYNDGIVDVIETKVDEETGDEKYVVGKTSKLGEEINVISKYIKEPQGIEGFINSSINEETIEYIRTDVTGVDILDLYLKDITYAVKILGTDYTIEEDFDFGATYMEYGDISLSITDTGIIEAIFLDRELQTDLTKYTILGANFSMNNEEIYELCGEPYYGDRYSFTYRVEYSDFDWVKFDFDQDGHLLYLLIFAAPDNTLGEGFNW